MCWENERQLVELIVREGGGKGVGAKKPETQ